LVAYDRRGEFFHFVVSFLPVHFDAVKQFSMTGHSMMTLQQKRQVSNPVICPKQKRFQKSTPIKLCISMDVQVRSSKAFESR